MKAFWKEKHGGVWICGVAAVTLLGVVHFKSVMAGARESGDLWLCTGYGLLYICALAFAALAGYLFFWKKDWKPERIFVICAAVLGTLYLFVLPPLSASDEVSHYITAYKLSNQMMGRTAVNDEGHVYIRTEDRFLEDIYEYDGERTTLGLVLDENTYRLYHERGIGRMTKEGTSVSVQPPVNTTPLAYIPQALGFTIARLMRLNCLGLALLGRLFNLAFYTGITYLAMKKLPFGKMVLFGIALLPMTLNLSGSLSYDVTILAAAWYFTACCLHLAYKAERVRAVDVAVLAAVMAVLGPCKIVYATLMGLCLLIPVRKFGDWRRWLLAAAVVFASFAAAMVLVNSQVLTIYTSDANNYVDWAGETGYTFSYVINSPRLILNMFYNTVVWQAEHYHLTMIGAYLGNLDEILDVPYVVVAGMTIGLLILSLRKPGDSLYITKKQKLWIWFLISACISAIFVSMLVTWTPVSAKVINGVQGRYFLPFLLIALLTIKNDFIVLTHNADRVILYSMCCANAYVLLRLFSIVSIRIP